jgi:N-acetylglucosaminyldiphosphoundecaprenol N-acetyl-beta-D-mannosaminyltransferase
MRVPVKGVGFDRLGMEEAVQTAAAMMDRPGGHYVVTPNPEIVWLARTMPELRDALNGADLVIPDGIGVIYAAKILGTPLVERVPGIELTEHLLELCAERGLPVYLLGAKPGVALRAGENLRRKHPGLLIAGCGDGYFQEDGPVLASLRSSGARLILVCLGFPRQELWMAAHRREAGNALMLGVGGSMDVFAGDVKRAPEGWCRLGLEWLYRLLSQPSRIRRMIKLPVFLLSVVWERLRYGKTAVSGTE